MPLLLYKGKKGLCLPRVSHGRNIGQSRLFFELRRREIFGETSVTGDGLQVKNLLSNRSEEAATKRLNHQTGSSFAKVNGKAHGANGLVVDITELQTVAVINDSLGQD